jgi:CheY-like chemotaxis protein
MEPSKLIVVCDDEPSIRYVIATKLKSCGYDVLVGTDGEEGLALCRENKPRLLITDFQMPSMSGLELCQALAGDESTAGIPILMLTARGHVISDEDLAKAGIREIIAKPFGVRQLVERVAEWMGAEGSQATVRAA